jgi:predicted nucleotidyltransferase
VTGGARFTALLDAVVARLPFEYEALNEATPVDFAGVAIPTVRAEDLVIYKAIAWREGDRTDIVRLLLRHGAEIDLSRVKRHVRQLAELMELPERADEFERLLDDLEP